MHINSHAMKTSVSCASACVKSFMHGFGGVIIVSNVKSL